MLVDPVYIISGIHRLIKKGSPYICSRRVEIPVAGIFKIIFADDPTPEFVVFDALFVDKQIPVTFVEHRNVGRHGVEDVVGELLLPHQFLLCAFLQRYVVHYTHQLSRLTVFVGNDFPHIVLDTDFMVGQDDPVGDVERTLVLYRFSDGMVHFGTVLWVYDVEHGFFRELVQFRIQPPDPVEVFSPQEAPGFKIVFPASGIGDLLALFQQAFPFPELLFHFLPVGNVADIAEEKRAVFLDVFYDTEFDKNGGATARNGSDFDDPVENTRNAGCLKAVHARMMGATVFFRNDEFGKGLIGYLFVRPTEDVFGPFVPEVDPSFAVDDHNGVGRTVENDIVGELALDHGVLCPFAFGDIAVLPECAA